MTTPASPPAFPTAQNTDRELWRGPDEGNGDYYADSIHVTESGGIGINCGGHVIVRPLREWHAQAATIAALQAEVERLRKRMSAICHTTQSDRDELEKYDERLEAAVAARAALELSNAGLRDAAEWRPAETAPEDGKPILVYRRDQGVFAAHFVSAADIVGGDDDESQWWSTDGHDLSGDLMFTHWMPCPGEPLAARPTTTGEKP